MAKAKQSQPAAGGSARASSAAARGGVSSDASGARQPHATGAPRGAQRAVSGIVSSTPRAVKKAKELATGLLGAGPSVHVDLVKNEWLAGYQVVVARITLSGGAIKVEAQDADYREVALRPVGGIDPETDPEGFLNTLAEHVHGSYLFATEPHQDDACKFKGMVVPIASQSDRLRHPEPV